MNLDNADLFGQWVLIALFVLAGIYLVILIVNSFRAKPPLHKVYTPIEAHNQLAAQVANHEMSTHERFAAIQQAASASREKLYNSINATREDVAALKAQLESNNAMTHHIDHKLDRALERLRP